jgi:hypothetical protein
MTLQIRPHSLRCRPNPGGAGATLFVSGNVLFPKPVVEYRSTAPSAGINHRPPPARHLDILLSHPLLRPMLIVSAVALGNGVAVKTPLFADDVHAALSCGLVAADPQIWTGSIDRLTLALRREQDARLGAQGRAKEIRAEIQRIESEREAFFAGTLVRDAAAVSTFAERVRQLQKLLLPTLLIEDAPSGSLEKAVARCAGSLLAVCSENLFGPAAGARRDLELLVRTLQGKSPLTALLQESAVPPPVRPLVGSFIHLSQAALARLASASDPLLSQFFGQVLLVDFPERPSVPPDCWFELMERLIARSGQERQLTLATAAHSRLAAYVAEIDRAGAGQKYVNRRAPALALKIALIFHYWAQNPGREISGETMEMGIAKAKVFVQASAATANRCLVAEPEEALNEEQRDLLMKITLSGPLSIRDLQRKFNEMPVKQLGAKLGPLIASGKVRRRADGLLEVVYRTIAKALL